MKKFIFFSFIFLILSCISNNKNQHDIPIDLSIINTHVPDNENGKKVQYEYNLLDRYQNNTISVFGQNVEDMTKRVTSI